MEKFSAQQFYRIARLLQILMTAKWGTPDAKMPGDIFYKQYLTEIRTDLESIGLRVSLFQLDRMISGIEAGKTTYKELSEGSSDLQQRIQDEM